MPTYRMTIERTVRFQLDLEAASRLDALKLVTTKALEYDDRDLKETHVIACKEVQAKPVLDPFEEAFSQLTTKGAVAWKDVPNATAWVDELRGD